MPPVKIAATLVEKEVEWIRNTGSQAGLGSNHVVDALGKRIRTQERKAAAEAPVHAELGGVITRAVVVAQIAALRVEQAPGLRIKHAVVHVLRRWRLAIY